MSQSSPPATIDSVLKENRVFPPPAAFSATARVASLAQYQQISEQAHEQDLAFWGELARELIHWKRPFSRVFDDSHAPFFRWFDDGQLNVSYNCLDRHLAQHAHKLAIIFESDDGAVTRVTYSELHRLVCRFANGLKSIGVQRGDRVVIYMPMSIEAVVAMQACARIGAVHSVVFGGFSARSLHERILDAGAVVVVTANQGMRGGKPQALKATVDEALSMGGCDTLRRVVVYRRTEAVDPAWDPARNLWWHDLVEKQPAQCDPEWMNAEDPLFILYTSGSTGTPKGIQHASGGYLLGALNSFRWVFDTKPDDIFWCSADIGWITGHSYVCYGPLGMAATQVVFEGVPTWPDAHRFWQMIERHRVTIFYTAPTAIRSLIKLGGAFPRQHDLSSLRLLGTVGEPINPEAWMWYHDMVGDKRCPIVDTWWQTETGSVMIAPLPGAVPTKPGSCTLPLPGIRAQVVDETGRPVPVNEGGLLVIERPFPSLARTIWGNPDRFRRAYFPEELGGSCYLAGDSARRDEDGYFWIMGRIDDVLNVSGHRLGTMEVESALVAHPAVAEAAVVGRPHDIKGEAIVAFVVLKGPRPEGAEAEKMAQTLRDWVAKEIGKLAQPDDIRFGEGLPKTRSGKIMRRLLRSLAHGDQTAQDISTLENPGVLTQLQA